MCNQVNVRAHANLCLVVSWRFR